MALMPTDTVATPLPPEAAETGR